MIMNVIFILSRIIYMVINTIFNSLLCDNDNDNEIDKRKYL